MGGPVFQGDESKEDGPEEEGEGEDIYGDRGWPVEDAGVTGPALALLSCSGASAGTGTLALPGLPPLPSVEAGPDFEAKSSPAWMQSCRCPPHPHPHPSGRQAAGNGRGGPSGGATSGAGCCGGLSRASSFGNGSAASCGAASGSASGGSGPSTSAGSAYTPGAFSDDDTAFASPSASADGGGGEDGGCQRAAVGCSTVTRASLLRLARAMGGGDNGNGAGGCGAGGCRGLLPLEGGAAGRGACAGSPPSPGGSSSASACLGDGCASVASTASYPAGSLNSPLLLPPGGDGWVDCYSQDWDKGAVAGHAFVVRMPTAADAGGEDRLRAAQFGAEMMGAKGRLSFRAAHFNPLQEVEGNVQ
jgi:hypothetical protein